ncbi:MAG: class I SAM-dependent methyltransferase [Thermoplasmata archaeon]
MPPHPPSRPRRGPAPAAERRFRSLDEYRVGREWSRYEGTPLRDLFRELRLRFLARHPCRVPGPVLEIGPGPGRFSRAIGEPDHPRILLDLSREALGQARRRLSGPEGGGSVPSEFVRGNGRRPPFRSGRFAQVVLLGNTVGFAGPHAEELLQAADRCLAPGGELLIELVAGTGEQSVYLRRLPLGALARLMAAPPAAIVPRVRREGFRPTEERRRPSGSFHRFPPAELERLASRMGWTIEERIAVAPALGQAPDRLEAIGSGVRVQAHLLAVEEELGRDPARWSRAAALLLAARRDRGI